jgi:hypothetical protein
MDLSLGRCALIREFCFFAPCAREAALELSLSLPFDIQVLIALIDGAVLFLFVAIYLW